MSLLSSRYSRLSLCLVIFPMTSAISVRKANDFHSLSLKQLKNINRSGIDLELKASVPEQCVGMLLRSNSLIGACHQCIWRNTLCGPLIQKMIRHSSLNAAVANTDNYFNFPISPVRQYRFHLKMIILARLGSYIT